MSIQRYHFYNIYGTPIPDNKVIDDNGDYVLYTDHAAEVERLTAERDAAVARAERAESDITTARLLLRSVWRSLDAAGRSMGRSLDAVALETAMELIDRHFETPFAKAQIYDESPVDFIESTRAAIAAAPDKPQYTDLSPEPWGGPEGEE